jgi:ankyrin repeat protein
MNAAARANRPEILRLLMKCGADPRGVIDNFDAGWDWTSSTPLGAAAIGNAVKCGKLLLRAGAHPDGKAKEYGGIRTCGPLASAAIFDSLEMARLLVDAGAKKDQEWDLLERDSETALHLALGHGSYKVAEYLIKAKADFEEESHNFGGTPFARVCGSSGWGGTRRQAGQLAELMIVSGLDPNGTAGGGTPLELVLKGAGVADAREDLVRLLLEAGAAPNLPCSDGRRPLQLAVANGDEAVVKLLRAAGAV